MVSERKSSTSPCSNIPFIFKEISGEIFKEISDEIYNEIFNEILNEKV